MRPATLNILVFVVFGFAANAQLTVLPQFGLENTRTKIFYNNSNSFAPLGAQSSAAMGIRADYKFKKLHGPFLGLSTSRSIAALDFSETATGTKFHQTTVGNYQVRVEGGYQYSSKPVYFNKKKVAEAKKAASIRYTKVYTYSSRCGRTYIKEQTTPVPAQSKDKGWHMSIQPSLGAALIPSVPDNLLAKEINGQPGYQYNAGNWSTALLAGAGFEFGKNDVRKFVLSVQYIKGMGNLNNTVIQNTSAAKETVTTLSSDVSGWNIKAGIPITLGKKKPVVKVVAPAKPLYEKKGCERYSRCGRVSI